MSLPCHRAFTALLLSAVCLLALPGCGDADGKTNSLITYTGGGPSAQTLGGTVSGLNSGQSITLVNNGADALTGVFNGVFAFSPTPAAGSNYDVALQSHTAGISCTIDGATGTMEASGVQDILVTCATGKESTVYAFGGNAGDGATPQAGLTMDAAGNLYGTTFGGGPQNAAGTVFKITPDGEETILHAFAGGPTDGAGPQSNLLMDSAGNLYGSTASGGANGGGTVFKISPDGVETVLHSFAGGTTDGANAIGGVVMDSAGNLYGTTQSGGSTGSGTVYKIATDNTESILYSFDGMNGANPQAGLIIDKAGNLYGTTNSGANGAASGGVFKLTPAGEVTDLYSFAGSSPGTPNSGKHPEAGLVMDSAGNLYGTTYDGGANDFGTVFEISADGTQTVLHSFAGGTGDGAYPQAGLIIDSAGNLFGTTYGGGADKVGTVFMLSTAGITILRSFAGDTADGGNPQGALVMDSAGNLYGTTSTDGQYAVGTVFEIN